MQAQSERHALKLQWFQGLQPMIYHCLSRVVERRFAFGPEEKEKLRTMLRMYEHFSGCRVLAYCFMCNHIHVLLEVPAMRAGGLSDEELLRRLRHLYDEAYVAEVAKRLREHRTGGNAVAVKALHESFSYRMHSLSEFMKGFMQRFTQWFNRSQKRSGGLWEDVFKSVLVEDGIASKTMAAYIDLNPVRAGMVKDPAAYRWSSYGEAMGGGPKGDGKQAQAGLVRALLAHQGGEADARQWAGKVARSYRRLLLEEGVEKLEEAVSAGGELEVRVVRKGMKVSALNAEAGRMERGREEALGRMLRCRVRYFTDGAVLGSRGFVDEVFRLSRDRFGVQRKSGARRLHGSGAAAAGLLWSVRDLQKGIR